MLPQEGLGEVHSERLQCKYSLPLQLRLEGMQDLLAQIVRWTLHRMVYANVDGELQ